MYLQAIPKDEIWPKVKEEVKSQPQEYCTYFEDWLFASDIEIGSYSYFGMLVVGFFPSNAFTNARIIRL